MTYKELSEEIEDVINNYFKENLKDYKFKSADDEEETRFAIEQFIYDIQDYIDERAKQIEYALEDNAKIKGEEI